MTEIAEYVPETEDGVRENRRKTELQDSYEKPKASAVREVELYLSDYRTYAKMIEMNRYERDYFAKYTRDLPEIKEEAEAYLRAKLFDIRCFILSLPDCDEKLLLYYHYVHGESLARCAELLEISRATVYRLKKRALETADEYYRAARAVAL